MAQAAAPLREVLGPVFRWLLDRVIAGSPQDPHMLGLPELRQVSGELHAPTGDLTKGQASLPIVDDEIIDRALAVQPLAGRPVTLLTCDTNQPRFGHARSV